MGERLLHVVERIGETILALLGVPDMTGALIAGAILGSLWVISWHRRRLREGKPGVEPHHLVLYGLIGAAVSIVLVAAGVIWQGRSPPTNATLQPPQGIEAAARLAAPSASQPAKKFYSQAAKERIDTGLVALSTVFSVQVARIVALSKDAVGPDRYTWRDKAQKLGGAAAVKMSLEGISVVWVSVNSTIFENGTLCNDYRDFADDLRGILPQDSIERWRTFQKAMSVLSRTADLLQSTESAPDIRTRVVDIIEENRFDFLRAAEGLDMLINAVNSNIAAKRREL